MDTGATEHVCGPQVFTQATLTSGARPALMPATTGELLKHYGMRTVDFRCQGEELRVGFTVVDVKRPTLSISRLMDRSIETFIQTVSRVCVDLTVRLLNSHVVVVFSFYNVKSLLRCCWHLWMMSQRWKLLLFHLLTRRWSANWWDEKRCDHQLRSKFRHQVSQPVESGDIMDSHTCHINLGATSASELVAEKIDMSHDHKSSLRLLLPEDRGRRANDHSSGSH